MHAGMPHFFFFPFFVSFGLFSFLLAVIPYWFIFKKAGFSPWLSLLMLIPVVNLFVLYIIAFSRWKVSSVVTEYGQPGAGGISRPPV